MITKQEIDDRIEDLMIEASLVDNLVKQFGYDFNEDTDNIGIVFEFIEDAKTYIKGLKREIKDFKKYVDSSVLDEYVYVNIQGE
jgi:hypothetical protein